MEKQTEKQTRIAIQTEKSVGWQNGAADQCVSVNGQKMTMDQSVSANRQSTATSQTVSANGQNTAAEQSASDNGQNTATNQTVSANGQTVVTCGVNNGSLPGLCAPMAFPYVPMQESNPVRYSRMEALETGTLFPGFNLPFKAAIQERTHLANTALVELMALDFAIQELGLYLTTHAADQEALQLYWSYLQMA